MSLQGTSHFGDEEGIARIKAASGWCIDARRRQDRMSQETLAKRAGITARWLREVESGNPRATIDDHLRCASAVGLSVAYILIPMLFEHHGLTFPKRLLIHDLTAIEAKWIEVMSGLPIAAMS